MSEENTILLKDENNASLNDMSNDSKWAVDEENDPEFILFTFILHGIITNTVGFIGLIGNIICIMVLRRPQMRGNSTNVILSALAAFDAFLIVTSMLMLGFPAVCRYSDDVVSEYYYTQIYPYITPCVYAFGLIAQTGSIYCTLGVTVERYIVICWPLRSSNICTYGRAKMAIVLIALFSLVYNIPRFFEVTWDTPSVMDEDLISNASTLDANSHNLINGSRFNVSHYNSSNEGLSENVKPWPTSLRRNEIYISVYVTWMYLGFMYVLPFGGLSVLNLLIYLDVRRSNARQSTLSQSEKKELRLAVMLMTVVVVFQICNILPLIVNILEVSGVEAPFQLTQTSNLLVTVNSSVNIFIYIIMGEKFKRQFLQCLSENMSCCYGGDNERVCCPLITCWRKIGSTGGGGGGGVTGTTDFYMTDALITHPSTRTTCITTSNHHMYHNQITSTSISGVKPINLQDTHSNNPTTIVLHEPTINPLMLGSGEKDDSANSVQKDEIKNKLPMISSGDKQTKKSLDENFSTIPNPVDGNNKDDRFPIHAIKDGFQENKNINDLPTINHEDCEDDKQHKLLLFNEEESNTDILSLKNGKKDPVSSSDYSKSCTVSFAISPKASNEELETSLTMDSSPTQMTLRNGEQSTASHLRSPALENTQDRNNTPNSLIVLEREHGSDWSTKNDSKDNLVSTIHETNQDERVERTCENNETVKVNDLLSEVSPLLQHIDSDENTADDHRRRMVTTTNIIVKMSNSPILSKKFRDV